MQPSESCIALVEKYEGFKPTPYVCPAGWLTVGFGHVLTATEIKTSQYANGITQLQGYRLLKTDLLTAANAVGRLVRVPLTQGQFDALVSFTFNLGAGRLQSSTLRQKVNRREYTGAAAEFKRWVYGGGVKLPGLVLRRAEEAALFMRAAEGEPQYVILPWRTALG